MANYSRIIELRPEFADFVQLRRNPRYRGEVLAYPRNLSCRSFSTDGSGFRHSTLQGQKLSVADCLARKKHGLVLGASNNFGFGIAGNENTMASLLADRFGFPFANVAMPGGNSRNLHALLVGFLAKSKTRPTVVVHSSGGDLGSFCQSSLSDPVFGPPNRGQIKGDVKERSLRADAERNLPRFLAFTGLWTTAIANLCRAYRIPLVQIHQSTFFEKGKPNATEREFGLGEPFHKSQEREFANFRKVNARFYAQRKAVAEKLGIPLAGWGLSDQLSFIDEFHLDNEGTRLLSDAVANAIEPLLKT